MRTCCLRQPVPGIVMTLLLIVFMSVAILDGTLAEAAAEKADAGKPVVQNELQRLEGKWVRPDGGYVLELKNIKKDGSLTAAYFNPRPIRVFRAEASKKDGAITLFVELRDVNYPGSTYRLQYDPATDRLAGSYFQAVERQTFNVQFMRAR
jgi:uncharacterized protein (DUF2147 family)